MITTPFGPIKIYTDGVVLDYEATTHTYNRGPVKDHPVPEIVFGIAWATNYDGADDVRTWFAADPTLDK